MAITRSLQYSIRSLLISFLLISSCNLCRAQWVSIGPDGGDARSLAISSQNPDRVFLGTSSGGLFRSDDGGRTWTFTAQFGFNAEYVLERIAIDPRDSQVMYVALWSINDKNRGALYKSADGGKSWQSLPAMLDKSIRALAIAPSNPDVLVVGALQGIFRSADAGAHWQKLSEGTTIKNVHSLAISPQDSDVIFAGTWHLGWKTSDGGQTWSALSKGILDDSDIFSIIVDPLNPSVVYASACSGIYKSEDSGESFRKLTGIPFSARRTHVLKQVSDSPGAVYAGTTQGLWRTTDAGASWKQLTSSAVVVNDVIVDWREPAHVILASDRMGILTTSDAGRSFTPSNRGFSHRQLQALVADPNTQTLYAGSINDREFGGVYRSHNAGLDWEHIGAGLGNRDVYALERSATGTLIAGTNDGVFILPTGSRMWQSASLMQRAMSLGKSRTRANFNGSEAYLGKVFHVRTINRQGNEVWIAATSEGVFSSSDEGQHWVGGAVIGNGDFTNFDCKQDQLFIGNSRNAFISRDLGQTWQQLPLPNRTRLVTGVLFGPDLSLWVTTDLGAFRSDNGNTWHAVTAGNDHSTLSYINVTSQAHLVALSARRDKVFESNDAGATWNLLTESQRPLRQLLATANQLFGVVQFGGIVVGTFSESNAQSTNRLPLVAQGDPSN